MHMDFETVSTLQYRNRSLTKQVKDFRSSEKYIQMAADYKELLRFHHREMKRLEYELSKVHSETVTVRRYWGEVMDDLEKEYREQIRRLETEIERLKNRILNLPDSGIRQKISLGSAQDSTMPPLLNWKRNGEKTRN